MKSSDTPFEFPVLGISADNDLWGFPDLRRLTTSGPRTLRDGMQAEMELIDAQGRRWIVRDVHRLGRAGAFLPWLLRSLLSTAQYRIEHDLEPAERLSLAQVQERVRSAMNAHPEFWRDAEDLDSVLPDVLSEVMAAQTIAELHGILGLDTFEAY